MSRFASLVVPECLRDPLPVAPLKRTDGSIYEGVRTYAGRGVVRHCMGCNKHKPSAGGKGSGLRYRCAGCVALRLSRQEPAAAA